MLLPISGFRSIEYQEKIFFNLKAERKQTAYDRALVSAPPGHSEHHTGYAIDISTPSIGGEKRGGGRGGGGGSSTTHSYTANILFS